MPSPARLQYGSFYHIYNRGNNRENIFIEQRNYDYFLKLYEKYIPPIGDTYAYCLLRNHFHLLIRIKTEEELAETDYVTKSKDIRTIFNPSRYFSNFFNAYAKSINKVYSRTGSLFQNPFGRVRITSDAHLIHLVVYIHRNPQKHGLINSFSDWQYSSFSKICSTERTFLDTGSTISWFYGRENFIASHMELVPTTDIGYLISDDDDL